jgi:hypothetical protein
LNIGVDPKHVERQRQLDLLQRVGDDSLPLLRTVRASVQPVETSVALSDK